MPKNDHDTFVYITSKDEDTYLINLLTYALYADEKAKWIEHFETQSGSAPTADDVGSWVGNITDQYFDHMRLKAARFFDEAAREYLASEIEEKKKEILESAIISKVQAAGNFWRQLGMALLTAVISPIIIGGMIASVLAYNKIFPTFVQVPTQLERPGKVGNETGG